MNFLVTVLLGSIKAMLTRKLIMELFLLLGRELVKRSDNKIDDQLMGLVERAARGDLSDDKPV